MSNFCTHSHAGISIVDSRGQLRPCCKWSDRTSVPTIFDIDSLDNIHTTTPYQRIQQQLESGSWPKGCASCKRSESAGLESRRQFTNAMYDEHDLHAPGYIQDLEIALDYTCNMMCRICNAGASSKWGSAQSVIQQFLEQGIETDSHTDYRTYQEQFRHVFERTDLSHARHVKLEGGEPFYAKNFVWFLDKLDREVQDKHKLFLNITTNGSVFPEPEVIARLKKYETAIAFSLDAAGDLADCIRWGVKWDQIAENVRKFKQAGFHCLANVTVSILNFNRLGELLEFCEQHGVRPGFSELTDPGYLSMYQLPLATRQQYLSGVAALDRVITADIDVKPEFDKLYNSVIILDNYQGRRFADVNPEIWELINANIR